MKSNAIRRDYTTWYLYGEDDSYENNGSDEKDDMQDIACFKL